jgi:methyl-accepting chemotaxis protein
MPKIACSILVPLTFTSAIGFLITQRRINSQAEAAFVEHLRKMDGMASEVRAFFSHNMETYVPHHQFKQFAQVPVVAAWTVARDFAETQGMKFSTPSLAPRDPKNKPDAFESEALEAFSRDPKLAEYYRRDTVKGQSVIRYAQPVRLSEDCLLCHGDPVGSKDPFGYVREGMKVGDLKGAFVLTAPVNSLSQTSRANSSAIFLITLFTLLAGVGAVFQVVRRFIVVPVAAATQLAKEIAANNLAVADIETDSHDEVGEAVCALNSMKNNLHSVVENIAATAERIASAGHELASTATEQSAAAATQTDRTSQVAAAMHELSATVDQVSASAHDAAQTAGQATETARSGGEVVASSVANMRAIAGAVSAAAGKVAELGKSSDKIGEIVAVIEDIADQTNLLALNAAIEAARAGEQGRGFAVVADEVRKLAERTSRATHEIASRIRTIQSETKTVVQAMEVGSSQVEEGVIATEKTGESLQEIIRVNDCVRDMINQIAATTAEQSATSTHVSKNVGEIEHLAQASSNGALEAAKACEELSALALDLEQMVRQFTLRGSRNESRRATKTTVAIGAAAGN